MTFRASQLYSLLIDPLSWDPKGSALLARTGDNMLAVEVIALSLVVVLSQFVWATGFASYWQAGFYAGLSDGDVCVLVVRSSP